MAFSLKANSAALEQVHDSLMEASRSCGATMWQSLKDIVIPLVRPGMISAFFLIFLPDCVNLRYPLCCMRLPQELSRCHLYLNEDGVNRYGDTALAGIALIIIVCGRC